MPKQKGLITNFKELQYNPNLKDRAKEMRNNSTKSEIKFWCELLRKRETGYQFYRQKIIDHYIVDFYFTKLKLVVEIDGESHEGKEEYDKKRDDKLNSYGLKVLHYNDITVLHNFQLVEKDFKKQIKLRASEIGIS